MPSTFEPSAHDKLAQAQYEEMLQASVLSEFRLTYYSTACLTHSADQANAVYNEDQCHSCKFEVVISYPGTEGVGDFIIASLIVPRVNCDHKPNQFPALQ